MAGLSPASFCLCASDLGVDEVGFGDGRAHAGGMIRPDVVVVFEPLIDHGLGLSGCCGPFCVEDFATQCSVDAFGITAYEKPAAVTPLRAGCAHRLVIDQSASDLRKLSVPAVSVLAILLGYRMKARR